MTSIYKQYIGGAWTGASNGGTWDVVNPATEESVATVPFGNESDCIAALEAAHEAFPSWSASTPYERGSYLRRIADLIRERADRLGDVTVRESGKPMGQAKGEWQVAADLFEWYSEEGKRAYGRTIPSRRASKRMTVLRQPIGVVGVITAWNFPAYNPVRAWAAALGAGCTVVARPSELTPLTAMEIVNLAHEAGLPKGVLNLVNGEPAAMGQALLDSPICRKISFTGSVRVGRILMDGASRTFTRLSLELGGNAPVLIFPDADLEALARSAVAAKYRNAGQVCVSPQRFLVHSSRAEEFSERVAPHVRELKVGNGLDPGTEVGPMINRAQRDRVEALVADARAKGLEVLSGGGRPQGRDRGYFFEPTVVTDVPKNARAMNEEPFGPLALISPFTTFDEVAEEANRLPYGLASYAFTSSTKTATAIGAAIESGMVAIKRPIWPGPKPRRVCSILHSTSRSTL